VSHCLGNLQRFVSKGATLRESAQFGMAPGEDDPRSHGGQDDKTEALVTPRPVEGRYGLPATVNRPTIVALGPVGKAKICVRHRLQSDLPIGRGECKGTLGSNDGLVISTSELEID
jgi:hypothetical protein